MLKPASTPHTQHCAFSRTFQEGHLTLGLAYPLENVGTDMRSEQHPRMDIQEHVALTQLAEKVGFSAVWARDVPLHDPDFGDVGHIYDPWTFLSYIAASTETIGLGTAGVVLPLHHPIDIAKQSASLDQISGGRFIMGVVSGDRPIEYPAYGKDQGARGEDFRASLDFITKAHSVSFRPINTSSATLRGADVIPKPTTHHVPMLVTGSAQQSMEWIAEHGDGWITYPRGPQQQKELVGNWHQTVRELTGGFKPFAQSLGVDLAEDPDAEMQSRHMGYRLGRNALVEFLRFHRDAGVNHVILGLRSKDRPMQEVIEELGEYVLPEFSAAQP
ncbi:TIGR03571 family LLM class oxidoreductase [Corynebacterium sp. zg254]|uniref:LLM class oxidoreductase n=1 Tax=Corynebacterium zhongnanshanii TaxID=2768834 RepID=A0ABQ6VCI7_9CORY|nr:MULTISPECIES: LLM class oxidoreductase [Corynebacterium]KAB3519188.1 LLM class oxidoreductase [Corynebacterium zhongnanshanii]MCR5915040.1 TIGR03571 family LLM class oxidoreductase [Corynebacterium sp. zg254]